MGNSANGRTGHGNERQVDVPTCVSFFVELGQKVVDLAAGGSLTACVTEDGGLYTMGNNDTGMLGHGDKDSKLIPTRVQNVTAVGVY